MTTEQDDRWLKRAMRQVVDFLSVVVSGTCARHLRKGIDVETFPALAPTARAAVERLSERFNDTFRTFEAGEDLFAPDVLFDLNMPVWRFQLQGPQAWAAQLRSLHHGGDVRVDIVRTVPTVSGFVTEHVEHGDVHGEELSARRLWLCEVVDGQIVEVVGYCSGEWNAELRARHAAEAPMIRP